MRLADDRAIMKRSIQRRRGISLALPGMLAAMMLAGCGVEAPESISIPSAPGLSPLATDGGCAQVSGFIQQCDHKPHEYCCDYSACTVTELGCDKDLSVCFDLTCRYRCTTDGKCLEPDHHCEQGACVPNAPAGCNSNVDCTCGGRLRPNSDSSCIDWSCQADTHVCVPPFGDDAASGCSASSSGAVNSAVISAISALAIASVVARRRRAR